MDDATNVRSRRTKVAEAIKKLRIVAFQEGDLWVAQCVDYDLCVQGADIAQAKRRMDALIQLEAKYTFEKHGAYFAGLDAAPDFFEAMYNEAEESLSGDLDFRLAA
jgi:hypothetical protein